LWRKTHAKTFRQDSLYFYRPFSARDQALTEIVARPFSLVPLTRIDNNRFIRSASRQALRFPALNCIPW
jgi:hypothetical protein